MLHSDGSASRSHGQAPLRATVHAHAQAPVTGWRELQDGELDAWNQRLRQEPTASIRQYPLFNEGLRGAGGLWVTVPGRYTTAIARARRWTTTPRYVVHESPDGAASFACIVSIGLPGFRVGCILDGPVTINGAAPDVALRDLVVWARRNHYIALRLTHSSEAFLDALSRMVTTERIDGVPFYPYPAGELYVDLLNDEAAMLSRFQKIARQEIRKAREVGYVVSVDHDPAALEKAWSAFESRSAQKGISYRDLATYTRMMREAEPHRAAHLYSAWRDSRPVAAILILRDRTTAHYFLGTVDADALGDAPSPACLLHWTAMRQALEMGAGFYNLGTRSGSVYAFKAKFRPVEHARPAPLTVIVNPRLYQVWRRVLPRLAPLVR